MQMEKKANFIKRAEKKSKSHSLDLTKIRTKALGNIQTQSMIFSLKKQHIQYFIAIGVLDRKVIISYNNHLKLFGLFDLHAVHERIRYEYYCWKIKAEQWATSEISLIDPNVIEKGRKPPHNAYGNIIKCIFQVKYYQQFQLFNFKLGKVTLWGLTFQKNKSNELYITSHRPIYGKEFSQTEIAKIAEEIATLSKGRLPRIIDQWIGEFSCKSAYKFNSELPMEQAGMLIGNLGKCDFPWHCVHGRTTVHVKPWPFKR